MGCLREWKGNIGQGWLITGSGSGLGPGIAEAALATGDSIIAGARRPEGLNALVEQYGDRIKPVTLDVRDEAAAKAAVKQAMDTHGRLDVLVNNAGYQRNAPFEQITGEQFRDEIETRLFGMVYTTRAAVPVTRKQKSVHIFQLSSIGGTCHDTGQLSVSRSEMVSGRLSDSVAAEVASFGVKLCTLEPGGMRTNCAQKAGETLPQLPADYEPSVGEVYKMLAAERGNSHSDPKKIADIVVNLANTQDIPKRLILGKAAETYVEQAETSRAEEAIKYRDLTLSTEFWGAS